MGMYTLVAAISGGQDWADLAEPFRRIHPMYTLVFAGFVLFTSFGMLNVLVGMFVEKASELSAADRDLLVQENLRHNTENVKNIRELFEKVDVDNSGMITSEELQRCFDDGSVQSYFAQLDMELLPEQARGVFNLIDLDSSGKVSIDEFIMGI